MQEIFLSADELITSLLNLEKDRKLCLLDSCGVKHLGSHLLVAGIDPVEVIEINETDPEKTLKLLDNKLSIPYLAAIFTISYDFGLKLNKIKSREKEFSTFSEPDIFVALFDCLIIHDYTSNKTYLTGNRAKFARIIETLLAATKPTNSTSSTSSTSSTNSIISSNFSYENYLQTIETIQEFIRNGDTYQTNLTQQIRAVLSENLTPKQIFLYLRENHPAPFASFLRRVNDVVISASPERFFKVDRQNADQSLQISVSPIKGTRPRGTTESEDIELKEELLTSEKDRAENVMIVDLLRNDIGRVCKFGTVEVEKLCELEIHSTLFHLVSTVKGKLLENTKLVDIIRAAFPCGSITGAPKIRTMQIIDELESANRGLSMGAIGFHSNSNVFNLNSDFIKLNPQAFYCDLSVAIRTMVIRNNEAIFNVGGGIVIDSIPSDEYQETLVKAKALLNSIGANETNLKS